MSKSQFLLVVHGQILTAQFPGVPDICVRMSYVFGPDWTQLSGPSDILSACCTRGHTDHHTIDLPFEATFSSTNPYRWPQIVFACYGRDSLGHDVIRGYGAMHLPTTPGIHTRNVACFVPEPSSMFQRVVGSLWGKKAELVDPTLVARPEGRYATRVSTQGVLTIRTHVILKDTKKFGFDTTPGRLQNVGVMPVTDFLIRKEENYSAKEAISSRNEDNRQLPQLINENSQGSA